MVREAILSRLEAEFDIPRDAIQCLSSLLEEGLTPEHIARYRRDETGDPGFEKIVSFKERLGFLEELETRKAAIREQAQHGDALDAQTLALLDDCYEQEFLDDLAHYLRPHEHKAEARVDELGLRPLFDRIHNHEQQDKSPKEAAQEFLSEEKGLKSPEDVLAVIVLGLSERYGENPELRRQARSELSRGILKASAASPDPDGKASKKAKRYQDFFDFQEAVRKIPPNRMLALRKAEREGIIRVQLDLPEDKVKEIYRKRFSADVDPATPLGEFLDLIYQHSYQSLVHSVCEGTVRLKLKEKADRETVRSFGRSLRAQLLSPPFGAKRCMALRASRKSAWAAFVDEKGSVIHKMTLPSSKDEEISAAVEQIVAAIAEHKPEAIALPHSRRDDQAVRICNQLREALPSEQRPSILPVDETASVVFATSPSGRRRLPGSDTGMRATVSLAHRLQDPLQELVRIDPRGLGLGNNLTEVHQGMLHRQLDAEMAHCVGMVGVDVNSANTDFLSRVPGMSRDLARKVVEGRKESAYESLAQMREKLGIEDLHFANVAGFLRLRGGTEPLDATAVHPRDYALAHKVAELKGNPIGELLGRNHRDIQLQDLLDDEHGRNRVLDLLRALSQGDRDPRGVIVECNNEGVASYDDLKLDQQLRGRITNLTEFGAFVDLGIGSHGLIHMSQIPGSRLRDAGQPLAVGEVVSVYVVGLNAKDKRIALSMHKPRHLAEGRPATLGERMGGRSGGGRQRGGGGRGGGRGRQPEQEVFSRAARAPDRRGGPGGRMRKGSPTKGKDEEHSLDPFAGRSGGRGGGGGGRGRGGPGGGRGRGRGPGGGGGSRDPRVFTVESERTQEESRGHKGEFRSLAGLKNLLGNEPPADPPGDPTPDSKD